MTVLPGAVIEGVRMGNQDTINFMAVIEKTYTSCIKKKKQEQDKQRKASVKQVFHVRQQKYQKVVGFDVKKWLKT